MASSKQTDAQLDAALAAIARAGHDAIDEIGSTMDEHKHANGAVDEALVTRITAAVVAQQARERSLYAKRSGNSWRWIAGLATAASMLVAVWFGVTISGSEPLPSYAAQVSGYDAVMRGSGTTLPTAHKTLTLGNRLVVSLRPASNSTAPARAGLWSMNADGVQRIEVPIHRSTAGAFRLDARIGDELKLEIGQHRLWLVVTAGTVDQDAALVARLIGSPAADDSYILPLEFEVLALQGD